MSKYAAALDYLEEREQEFPVWDVYMSDEHLRHEKACHDWFISWMIGEEADMERYGEEQEYDAEERCESEELPF